MVALFCSEMFQPMGGLNFYSAVPGSVSDCTLAIRVASSVRGLNESSCFT